MKCSGGGLLSRGTNAFARLFAAFSLALILAATSACSSASLSDVDSAIRGDASFVAANVATIDSSELPEYDGAPYATVNNGVPQLSQDDLPVSSEEYSDLDYLGRCGPAVAVVSESTMPTEPRESIGMVRPSGWKTARYEGIVDGDYLYNRCHLLGFQLTGENANERNLVTGTRYFNTQAMLPFEDEVAEYVHRTGGRVLMRVTPIFVDDELVCRGVQMEALSLDDAGLGVCYNVFCHNVQPGVRIDYATGDNWRDPGYGVPSDGGQVYDDERLYVVNINTGKFHFPECDSVDRMREENRLGVRSTRAELEQRGYEPCGSCRP